MLIKNLQDFNLRHIFECGQCFRWNADENGVYTGVAGDYVIKCENTADGVMISCPDDLYITDYFDLNRDYTEIKNSFGSDEILKKACEFGSGIRILKQDPWETMISFIISANNNIPRIKKIIELLCTNFGEKLDDVHYKFPGAETLAGLTDEDLAVIRSGFRAKYIIDAARKTAEGKLDLSKLYSLPSAEARAVLKGVKGIGDKVADCILLFAYGKYDVFPKDVWIKRILNNLYHVENADFDSFVTEKFGGFGGFAQQYLFFYGREFI